MNPEKLPDKSPADQNDQETECCELQYSLHDLPTTQHKAGLAGMLLLIESLQRRRISPLPEIIEKTAYSVTIRITEKSLQTLFDDFYDASYVEHASKTKWSNAQLLREEDIEVEVEGGKVKTEKQFIYKVVEPATSFLTVLTDGQSAWNKLYRDMMWGTLRSRPTTRNPYNFRAEGHSTKEAGELWKNIQRSQNKKKRGPLVKLSSAIFLGAQAATAEKVPFMGSPEEILLLHFWTLATRIFCPAVLDNDGKKKDVEYVLVIPEPLDLVEFHDDSIEMFATLDSTLHGYRPATARIDVPAEGGLEYIGALARHRTEASLGLSIAAVETYHLEKTRKNVRMHGMQRIEATRATLERYEEFKKHFRNHIFKTQRLANLLAEAPWYEGFDSVMAFLPAKFFIQLSGQTPEWLSFFGKDTSRAFYLLRQNTQLTGGQTMTSETKDDRLARRVYDVVRTYVTRRTEEKSGIAFDSFKDKKNDKGQIITPTPYRDAKEKVCLDAFLAIRGRNDQDFVEYFAGTICSVPQFLSSDDFVDLSRALFEDWEKTKTLSLLALSAVSWSPKPAAKTETTETNQSK